jgi:hypothetical protein
MKLVHPHHKAKLSALRFTNLAKGFNPTKPLLRIPSLLRAGPHDIDCRGVEPGFQMGGIVFLNHLDARPAVFSNLIDIGTLQQPETNVCVPQAVGGSRSTVAVSAEFFFLKDCVE